MSKEKTKKSTMQIKIEKIKRAFEGVILPSDEDREVKLTEIVNICKVGNDLGKELKTHPGVYAYMAEQKVALQMALENKSYQLRTYQQRVDMLCENLVGVIRDTNVKLTEAAKKEIISALKLGTFKDSSVYHNLDFEDGEEAFARLNEQYDSLQKLTSEADEFEQEIIDYKGRYNLVSEIVDCLGFQKRMCLRALVDRETSGLAQQT